MNVYFYSPKNAILKADGECFELEKHRVLATEFSFSEIIFEQPFENSFVFPKNPKFCKNVRLIDVYDGILAIPKLEIKRTLAYKKLFEVKKNFRSTSINFEVVCLGSIFLNITSPYEYVKVELPFEPKSLEVNLHSQLPLALIILKAEKAVAICVDLSNLNILLKKVCDEIVDSNQLCLKTCLNDFCMHEMEEFYEINLPIRLTKRTIKAKFRTPTTELIPYAFLQRVRLGGDFSEFLSDEMLANKALIPEFLGQFTEIIPPFIKGFPDTIVLIEKTTAKYLNLSVVNGKICDLSIDKVLK